MMKNVDQLLFFFIWITSVNSSFQNECHTVMNDNQNYRDDQNCTDGETLISSVCLPKDYNPGEMPTIPTEVLTFFEINNIREINDKKMTVTIDFFQEMTWIDDRIKTNFPENIVKLGGAPLTNKQLYRIWTPPLWIQNLFSFELRSIFDPTVGLFIHRKSKCQVVECCNEHDKSNKTLHTAVTFNFEARATFFCNFDFTWYPFDTQDCKFMMSSAYPVPDVVVFRVSHAEFGTTFNSSNTEDFEIDITFKNITEPFSGLSFDLRLERSLLPYFMRYYLPCIVMVIVSFTNFLISFSSIPGRVGLLVTLFLTMTNVLIAQQAESPTSKFTALGIYLISSLCFVVASFAELSILLVMKNNHSMFTKRKLISEAAQNDGMDVKNDVASKDEFCLYIRRIENAAFFIFIASFLLFNFYYWYRIIYQN